MTLKVALVQVASSRIPAENRERLAGLDVPDADLVVLPEVYQRDLGRADDPPDGPQQDTTWPGSRTPSSRSLQSSLDMALRSTDR